MTPSLANDSRISTTSEDRARLDAIGRALAWQEQLRPSCAEAAGHVLVLTTLAAAFLNLPMVAARFAIGAVTLALAAYAWKRFVGWCHGDAEAGGQITEALAAMEDPRSVPALLALPIDQRHRYRGELVAAAGRLVATMNDQAVDRLWPAELDALCMLLRPSGGEPTFRPGEEDLRRIAVLHIMARRGYLPARREARLLAVSWRTAEVRDAARACLARLDELATAEKLSSTLLRPSEAPASEVLLRPAERVGDDQLLRPSSQGPE